MNKLMLIILLFTCFCFISSLNMDPSYFIRNKDDLNSKNFWISDAQKTLIEKLKYNPNKNVAKNIIMFLGDGLSVATATASRIYEGQLHGIIGERNQLAFEQFPYVGLSKTYCADKQVADSACSATAYLCGIKANYNTIGVTANVTRNACAAANKPINQIDSIASWAQKAYKSTGIVTTTRITHASPAGVYAHTANRDYECDTDITNLGGSTVECPDIAKQLIENEVSKNFKVILGGGSTKFLPNTTKDELGNVGERSDANNLIDKWFNSKNGNAKFVSNRHQLFNVNTFKTEYLLGLFSPSHLPYHLDADSDVPTLADMTETAIKVLNKNEHGYFLFVEGGLIDHAHHETRAKKALDETVEFSLAIQRALELTSDRETLIVVTSDHGHTMSISGYPDIDNKITGLNTEKSDIDGLPYTTLNYANGPVYDRFYQTEKRFNKLERTNLHTLPEIGDKDFQYPHGFPLSAETHSGSDVIVYAQGPWSHLFSGVIEQSSIPALMGYAACIGPGLQCCNQTNA